MKKLTQTKLHQFAAMTDINRLRHQRLPSLLIPRVSGTAGNIEVRQVITNVNLNNLPDDIIRNKADLKPETLQIHVCIVPNSRHLQGQLGFGF